MIRATLARFRTGIFPLHLDPPTREHRAVFEQLLADPRLGLTRLILVPHSNAAITVKQSLHFAALAALSVRELKPFVDVDLSVLESPDPDMPSVAALLRQYAATEEGAALLQWSPDAYNAGCLADRLAGALGPKVTSAVPLVLVHPEMPAAPGGVPPVDTVAKRASVAWGGPARVAAVKKHLRGTDVRRMLLDESVSPASIIPGAVLRYIDSHGLYWDGRHRSRMSIVEAARSCVPPAHNYGFEAGVSPLAAGAGGSGAGVDNSWLALNGTVPRLELHYDPKNHLARQIYGQLRAFEVPPNSGEPDLIVPIGGDGYMMHCVRRHWRRFIPFFGVNAGHVGFLLNDAALLEELLSAPLRLHLAPMLYCKAVPLTSSGNTPDPTVALAFNDAWIERASGQTARLSVRINGIERGSNVRGDGILVSTAAGSTAYAQALGGSPLPVGAPILQLVGSNCTYPPRWRPVHLNEDVQVELRSLDTEKRPCRAFVDSVDLGLVQSLSARASRVAGVQLAFTYSCDLQSKLYKMQFPSG